MRHARHCQQKGFSLLELMIAVVVVGILAAIAYPAYTNQLQRGWRGEGKAAVLAAAQQEERFFSMNNTYTTTLVDAGIRGFSCSDANTAACRYTITVAAPAGGTIATGYLISATPQGWTDALCGTLTLDNLGNRGRNGTGSVAECWR